MGIRVRDHDGALLRRGRATIRAVLCVLFPLLLFWAVVDTRRRSVQDLACKLVVYHWKVGRTLPRSRAPRACRRCTVRHARTPRP